jgi:hypothetical protein
LAVLLKQLSELLYLGPQLPEHIVTHMMRIHEGSSADEPDYLLVDVLVDYGVGSNALGSVSGT